jgi:ABC-type glycerol-3-phosphate transport system substrate-binding protein
MFIKKFAPRLFSLFMVTALMVTVLATITPASAQTTSDTAPITVWVDAQRQPMVDAYIKAFPDKGKLIKEVVVDRETFPQKVLLFNNTNQGWPDVVFAEPRLVGRVADTVHHFPLDLTGLVPADTLKAYDGISNCTFGDKVYCLRNDVAPFVLFYNKTLMDKFKYTVPTTFEDLQALSDKVAKEHPGYLLGAFGDGWTFVAYFDAAGCPSHELVDDSTLKIDMTDARCVSAAKLVDHMIANKTMFTDAQGFFDPALAKQFTDNKVLLMSLPVWEWTSYQPKGSWDNKAGDHQIALAAPLKWAADTNPTTPALGGSAWTVSNHTANPKLAVDLVTWLTTSPDLWGAVPNVTAGGFPAYEPLQAAWGKQTAADPVWASDPLPALQTAAKIISPLDKWPHFDLISPFGQMVADALQKKATIESTMHEVLDKLQPFAEAGNYVIVAPTATPAK